MNNHFPFKRYWEEQECLSSCTQVCIWILLSDFCVCRARDNWRQMDSLWAEKKPPLLPYHVFLVIDARGHFIVLCLSGRDTLTLAVNITDAEEAGQMTSNSATLKCTLRLVCSVHHSGAEREDSVASSPTRSVQKTVAWCGQCCHRGCRGGGQRCHLRCGHLLLFLPMIARTTQVSGFRHPHSPHMRSTKKPKTDASSDWPQTSSALFCR